MLNKSLLCIGTLTALLAGPAAANINIVFDYSKDTGGFFSDTLRKNLLDSAANVFESRITDSLGAITPGSNTYSINFFNPSGVDSVTLNQPSIAANEIRIYVGATTLGGGLLGVGGPGGFGASGSSGFIDSLSRGQSGVSNDTDFAPWGGAIAFNSSSSTNWYFDNTLSTSNDIAGYDFYSVALHEIGHVLGYGTADSWNSQVDCSSGPCSMLGKPLAADKSHWAAGTTNLIDGISFEAAMDPTLGSGTRKNFTDLDWAGLNAIGWQVAAAAPVPEPETWAMLLAGLGLVGFAAGRKEKRRKN